MVLDTFWRLSLFGRACVQCSATQNWDGRCYGVKLRAGPQGSATNPSFKLCSYERGVNDWNRHSSQAREGQNKVLVLRKVFWDNISELFGVGDMVNRAWNIVIIAYGDSINMTETLCCMIIDHKALFWPGCINSLHLKVRLSLNKSNYVRLKFEPKTVTFANDFSLTSFIVLMCLGKWKIGHLSF